MNDRHPFTLQKRTWLTWPRVRKWTEWEPIATTVSLALAEKLAKVDCGEHDQYRVLCTSTAMVSTIGYGTPNPVEPDAPPKE